MKHFRGLLSVVLVGGMLLPLAACGSNDKKEDEKSHKDKKELEIEFLDDKDDDVNESESDNTDVDTAEDITQMYYDYINDVLIPAEGLTNLASSVIVNFQDIPFHETPDMMARNGILSADVRDYNADGILDLVTYSLGSVEWDHTSTGLVMSEWYGPQSNFYSVTARFYSLVDDEIILIDQVDSITELGADHVGTMMYGVYEDEGVMYIYASCDSETRETYSVRKTNIYHIEGNSFVFDATKGFYGFGQASVDSDPNVVAGTRGYDYAPTALGTALTQASFDTLVNGSGNGSGSVLGGVKITFYNSMDQVEANYYDISYLREVLVNGTDVLSSRPEMPVYEAPDNVDPTLLANEIAAQIGANGGSEFVYDNTNYIQGGGVTISYRTASGIELSLRFNAEGKLQVVNCEISGATVTDEWVSLKDAVLTDEYLNLDPASYQNYLGYCDMNQTSYGDDYCSIVVARMDSCWVNVSLK
ncbi:MAG: hypothetical protein MJ093_01555 [Saccharofermentans sp.]|nr:hypothetical protein [Saccharofermentans sp.]